VPDLNSEEETHEVKIKPAGIEIANKKENGVFHTVLWMKLCPQPNQYSIQRNRRRVAGVRH
jgi:hypothetical protein